MKTIILLALLTGASADAASNQIWACLEPVSTVERFNTRTTIFHKVTITRQSSGQLRGNYTLNPKSMMNYASIDVVDLGGDEFASEGPGQSLGQFVLDVSEDERELEVVVSESLDGQIYEQGLLRGSRAFLKVQYEAGGKTVKAATNELICNESFKKLFRKKN